MEPKASCNRSVCVPSSLSKQLRELEHELEWCLQLHVARRVVVSSMLRGTATRREGQPVSVPALGLTPKTCLAQLAFGYGIFTTIVKFIETTAEDVFYRCTRLHPGQTKLGSGRCHDTSGRRYSVIETCRTPYSMIRHVCGRWRGPACPVVRLFTLLKQ